MEGYHQCTLDNESQLLTTFITPFGCFKYLREPYGISSISEHYDRRMAEAFAQLTGFRRIVDDIDSDAATYTKHIQQSLKRCADKNVALNLAKYKFCQTRVTFAGFILSADEYTQSQMRFYCSQLQLITLPCIHSLAWPINCLHAPTQSPHCWPHYGLC